MEITTARLFIIEGQSTYPPTKAHRTEGNEKAKLHETTTFNSFSSCYIAPDAYCDCDRLQTNESYTADSMSEEEEEGRERERLGVLRPVNHYGYIRAERGAEGVSLFSSPVIEHHPPRVIIIVIRANFHTHGAHTVCSLCFTSSS